jgi:hypothetical protein
VVGCARSYYHEQKSSLQVAVEAGNHRGDLATDAYKKVLKYLGFGSG